MTTRTRILLMALFTLTFASEAARAATYFVMDTLAEPTVAPTDARVATDLVRSSVSSRPADILVEDEFRADFILQPKLLQLGESFILTVEKRRGQEILFAAQSKIREIDQLDRAARATTNAAIEQPSAVRRPPSAVAAVPRGTAATPAVPYQIYAVPTDEIRGGSISGTTSSPEDQNVGPEVRADRPSIYARERKVDYWTIGIGPFLARRLETDSVLYNFTLGHRWDINPRAAVRVTGEASLSSGGEDARFFNIGTGANYFFPGSFENAPYVTADIGYGWATDARGNDGEGFSFGTGVGYEFFRNTETTLDLLLRYTVIFDQIENRGGDPSVVGVRMAVNF